MMSKGMKSTVITCLVMIGMALVGEWMQLSKRMDIIEVQQENDHSILLQRSTEEKDMLEKINDIQQRLIHLQDVKMDKNYEGQKDYSGYSQLPQ